MSDLVVFLRARLDEDEQAARELDGGRWERGTDVGDYYNVAVVLDARYPHGPSVALCGVEYMEDGETRADHIARWDPARVLGEVEAKRRIIDWYTGNLPVPQLGTLEVQYVQGTSQGGPMLRMLALPYASHPDYRTEWKP